MSMNNKCITGLSPRGHCGAAAYCPEPHDCCAKCDKDCNIRCGYLPEREHLKKIYVAERNKAIRNRLGEIIMDFCYRKGHYPVAILAEPAAFIELVSDHKCTYRDTNGELRWGNHGIPLRKISSGDRGIYLFDEQTPVLVIPEED